MNVAIIGKDKIATVPTSKDKIKVKTKIKDQIIAGIPTEGTIISAKTTPTNIKRVINIPIKTIATNARNMTSMAL